MKRADIFPAPEVDVPKSADPKWEREYRAFLRLRPSLLQTHANKFVAIHEGKDVDSDEDKVALGLRVYAKFGYVPIYVGRVSADSPTLVRMPSSRARRYHQPASPHT